MSKYLVPNSGADSDLEVEDDDLDEDLDDDYLDPDYILDLHEDVNLTPTASGKQYHQYKVHDLLLLLLLLLSRKKWVTLYLTQTISK